MGARILLTQRQSQILDFIVDYLKEHGFPPSRQEIATAFGFASVNAAQQHLDALYAKGAIQIFAGISRGIRVMTDAKITVL